jgi:cephalosporin hydroxylase
MKITINTDENALSYESNGESRVIELYTREAFEIISQQWLKVGWHQKYSFTFSWMGRPIIQLPEDLIRIQEVIFRIRPAVILETGVAHGGSLVYYASLCKTMGEGRVIGVDIELRPCNRQAIEAHELFPYITLIEGDSSAPEVIGRVKSLIRPEESVLLILDSCHYKQHVCKELEAYHDLIKIGHYAVVCDGIIKDLSDVPSGQAEWAWDHPVAAVQKFAREHPEFVIEEPSWPFNESRLNKNVTQWPGAWLRKVW